MALLLQLLFLTVLSSVYAMKGEMVDLTHSFANDTIYFPGHRHFTLTNVVRGQTPGGFWLQLNDFETSEHGGTHMDAPTHFSPDGWAVDEIPIERLVCPAVVVDISLKAAQDPDSQILVEDLTAWEEEHGKIPDGAIVLLYSNWAVRWHDEALMLGNAMKDTANLHFPGFSFEAAKWLTDNRNIYAVGTDTISLDYGPGTSAPAHVQLLTNNIYGLENVNNLDKLPPKGATVYSFPMKISGGSGGPCRVIAKLPSHSVIYSGCLKINVDLALLSLVLWFGFIVL